MPIESVPGVTNAHFETNWFVYETLVNHVGLENGAEEEKFFVFVVVSFDYWRNYFPFHDRRQGILHIFYDLSSNRDEKSVT